MIFMVHLHTIAIITPLIKDTHELFNILSMPIDSFIDKNHGSMSY